MEGSEENCEGRVLHADLEPCLTHVLSTLTLKVRHKQHCAVWLSLLRWMVVWGSMVVAYELNRERAFESA